jgi:thioredoxin reductase (NADPH)
MSSCAFSADLAERAHEQVCRFGAEILLACDRALRAECLPHQMGGYLPDGTKIFARTL